MLNYNPDTRLYLIIAFKSNELVCLGGQIIWLFDSSQAHFSIHLSEIRFPFVCHVMSCCSMKNSHCLFPFHVGKGKDKGMWIDFL